MSYLITFTPIFFVIVFIVLVVVFIKLFKPKDQNDIDIATLNKMRNTISILETYYGSDTEIWEYLRVIDNKILLAIEANTSKTAIVKQLTASYKELKVYKEKLKVSPELADTEEVVSQLLSVLSKANDATTEITSVDRVHKESLKRK